MDIVVDLLIGAFIGSIFMLFIMEHREQTIGTLMVDETNPDEKQCYVGFTNKELKALPKSGFIKLKIQTFSRKKNNDSNDRD